MLFGFRANIHDSNCAGSDADDYYTRSDADHDAGSIDTDGHYAGTNADDYASADAGSDNDDTCSDRGANYNNYSTHDDNYDGGGYSRLFDLYVHLRPG